MLTMNRELPVTSGNNFIRKKIWAKGMVSSFSMEILNRRRLKLLNKYFNSCLISHGTCGNYFFSSWRFKKKCIEASKSVFLANCQKKYKQSITKIFATVRCVCVCYARLCAGTLAYTRVYDDQRVTLVSSSLNYHFTFKTESVAKLGACQFI